MLRKDQNEIEDLKAPQPDHPLFSGKTTVGMISGEHPRFPAQSTGHDNLGTVLQSLGLKAEPREGRYGTPEKSWMVYGPSKEQMFNLGRMFGQESVVFSQGGKHQLMYTNGLNTGKYHPDLGHDWFQHEPEDYYTHMPDQKGFLRLKFDFDRLESSGLAQPEAMSALESRSQVRKAVLSVDEIKKFDQFHLDPPEQQVKREHPLSYDWHDEHTDHHYHVMSPGVVLMSGRHRGLSKAQQPHPHMDGSKPPEAQPKNDQAAGVGVSTYAKFALPYGKVDPGHNTDLFHYPYHGKSGDINKLVQDHGYTTYYAGGKHGKPDLAHRNYNTKHLMVYDPSPGSGGDFGTEEYTDGWRKIHELSHALVYPELNKIYGEGRRIGKLGHHRTMNEALRAVHWEWLAAHKQRELSKQIGVHVPDHVFNKELNTVMHDAVHRAVTGKFTEPSGEGFKPHSHKLPLETALGMVREAAHNLGITGMHDLMKKSEDQTMADEKTYDVTNPVDAQDVLGQLAKSVKARVDAYSEDLVELRKREQGPDEKLEKAYVSPYYKYGPSKPAPKPASKPAEKPAPAAAAPKPATEKNEVMGYDNVNKPDALKAELCKECGKSHGLDKNCGSPIMDNPKINPKAETKKAEIPATKDVTTKDHGSGGKITKVKLPGSKLKKALPKQMLQHAAIAGSKALAGAPAAAAPKTAMPTQAQHADRASQFADFMPKPSVGNPTAPAKKPIALPGAGLKTAKPAMPPAGVGHLKPPALPGKTMSTAPAATPKPATPAAPVSAAPKAPAAAPTLAPKQPKAAAGAPAMKSEPSVKTNLRKSLGQCVLCNKAEHSGKCQ